MRIDRRVRLGVVYTFLLVVAVVLFYPLEVTLIGKTWAIRVVDQTNGRPVENARVERVWEFVPFSDEGRDFVWLGSGGIAMLPPKSIRKSIAGQLLNVIWRLPAAAHAGWGLQATLVIDADGYHSQRFSNIFVEDDVVIFRPLRAGGTATVFLNRF